MQSQLIPEEEDASKLQLGPDFKDALSLLNSEVAVLLERSPQDEGEQGEGEFSGVFMKTLNYTKRFSKFKNKTAVKEVRGLLAKKGLEEFEIAALSNLCPETSDEAKTLIPTLAKKFTDDELEGILNDLKNYSTLG